MCARLEDQHSLITTARVHGECACASRCCKGLASRQIIGMGLSKTGTTATVLALEKVGLRVAHDRGDQIGGQCQAILNTLEDSYECLDRAYPTASWVITYTANVSLWVASLQSHLREPYTQRIANRSYLACRVFGCSKGVPTSYASDPRKLIRVNPHTNRVVREDEERLRTLIRAIAASSPTLAAVIAATRSSMCALGGMIACTSSYMRGSASRLS